VIRRLYLYRPITDDEASAAGAWAERLGDDRLTISYRPSSVAMRILMFDAVSEKGKWRHAKVRLLPAPEEPAADALREAMATGDVVFNVYTGREDDRSAAWSGTDAVFSVAFPDGQAVAWFNRVAGGIAPGIANNCLSPMRSVAFIPIDEFLEIKYAARYLFFKRRPPNIRQHEELVMAFALDLLDAVPIR
jgi:hypothetical protein